MSDVEAFFKSVRDKVDIVWPLETMEYGQREFGIRDPDGYTLAFAEADEDDYQRALLRRFVLVAFGLIELRRASLGDRERVPFLFGVDAGDLDDLPDVITGVA